MIENLQKVFNWLFLVGLKLKLKKCILYGYKVDYLGYVILQLGVVIDFKKIDIIKEWIELIIVKEVRVFLGLCSYYWRFVKDFGLIVKFLYKLINKDVKFKWMDEC